MKATLSRLTFIGLAFIFLVHALGTLAFHDRLVDTGFILFSLIIAGSYFYWLQFFGGRWQTIQAQPFLIRLFLYAFLLRIAAVVILYYFFDYTTGQPFEYHAVDSIFYHEHGMEVANHFRSGDFDIANMLKGLNFSDKGYNIWLGIIYSVFGNGIIIPRLINALLGAFTVIGIYRIAKIIFNEPAARLAGIMAMLLPNFLFYLGTHLKETVMLWLLVLALLKSVQLVKQGQRTAKNITWLIMLFFLLFMFRTILAAVMFSSFLLYALLYKPTETRWLNITAVCLLVSCFLLLVINSQVGTELAVYYEKSSNSLSNNLQFRANREGGNKFALLAGAPLLLSLVMMAPFPSWVYVEGQDFLWLFAGANLVRNLYAFFAIAALIRLAPRHWRNISLLIAFLGGYFIVLANSGLALSERFQLPAVPVLLILAAWGITRISRKGIRNYHYYLLFAGLLILGWNYIKIAGRL